TWRTVDRLGTARSPHPDRRRRRTVSGAAARATRHRGRCMGGRSHRTARILAGGAAGSRATERAIRAAGAGPQARPGGPAAPLGRRTVTGHAGRRADATGSLPATRRMADDGVRAAVSAPAGRSDRQRLRPGATATTPGRTGRTCGTTVASAPADE